MVAKETSDEAEGEGGTFGRYLDICVSANRPCTSIKDRDGMERGEQDGSKELRDWLGDYSRECNKQGMHSPIGCCNL